MKAVKGRLHKREVYGIMPRIVFGCICWHGVWSSLPRYQFSRDGGDHWSVCFDPFRICAGSLKVERGGSLAASIARDDDMKVSMDTNDYHRYRSPGRSVASGSRVAGVRVRAG